jgi:hypothetical protein
MKTRGIHMFRAGIVLALLLGLCVAPALAQSGQTYATEDNVLTFELPGVWYIENELIISETFYRFILINGEPNPFVTVPRSRMVMDVMHIDQNTFYDFPSAATDLRDYLPALNNHDPDRAEPVDEVSGRYPALTLTTPDTSQTMLLKPNETWLAVATVTNGDTSDFDADILALNTILHSVSIDVDADPIVYQPYPLASMDLSQTALSEDDEFQLSYPNDWILFEHGLQRQGSRRISYLWSFTLNRVGIEMEAQLLDPTNASFGLPSRMRSIEGYFRTATRDNNADIYILDEKLLVIITSEREVVAIQQFDDRWIASVKVLARIPDAETLAVNMLRSMSIAEERSVVPLLGTNLFVPLRGDFKISEISSYDAETGDRVVVRSNLTGTELIIQAGSTSVLKENLLR